MHDNSSTSSSSNDGVASTAANSVKRPRWWLCAIILLAAGSYLVFTWTTPEVPTDERVLSTLNTVIVTSLSLLLWLLLLSRLRWRTRFGILAAALVMVLFCVAVFRVEGVSGDMVPLVRWRWQRSKPLLPATNLVEHHLVADHNGPPPLFDYPGFMGRHRDAVVSNVQVNADWKTHPPRLLWQRPLGTGWSSFAVQGVFAITQELRGNQEVVVAYDVHTGSPRWWSEVQSGAYRGVIAGDGPRATPTIVDDRVYVFSSLGRLSCLELENGQQVWSVDVLQDNDVVSEDMEFGRTCSPLVTPQHVVVTVGGSGKTLVAYNCKDGTREWRSGDDIAAYTSPAVVSIAGQQGYLLLSKNALTHFRIPDGHILWSFDWPTIFDVHNVAQPVLLDDNSVAVFTGFGVGGALINVKENSDGKLETSLAWRTRWLRPNLSNVVYHNGYFYGLDSGIMVCLDAATGERMWKRGRYGHGQLLLVGGVLLVQCETGEVVLVDPQPTELHELARFEPLQGKTWNHPALAPPYLLLRNDQQAACYQLELLAPSAAASGE